MAEKKETELFFFVSRRASSLPFVFSLYESMKTRLVSDTCSGIAPDLFTTTKVQDNHSQQRQYLHLIYNINLKQGTWC